MKRNPLLMDRLIRNLGENVAERWDHDPEGRVAGMIVDTPASFAASSGAANEHRHALIKACVDAFRSECYVARGLGMVLMLIALSQCHTRRWT